MASHILLLKTGRYKIITLNFMKISLLLILMFLVLLRGSVLDAHTA